MFKGIKNCATAHPKIRVFFTIKSLPMNGPQNDLAVCTDCLSIFLTNLENVNY